MTPYYDHAGITIYHGDCRELGLILSDAIVTDPPYGTTARMNGYGREGVTIQNDSDLSAIDGFLCTTAADWLIAFCDSRRRRELEDIAKQRKYEYVGDLIWDKGMPSMGYTIRYAHELALVWRRDSDVRPVAPIFSVLRGQRTTRDMARRHPHEKPVEVMGRIVEFCVPIGGTVYDPFCGTGATLIAAKDLGRKAIGIEIEERYCEIAAQRLEQEVLAL